MLALTRHVHEEIVLRVPGFVDPIIIKVVRASGPVRLGIEAPHAIRIVRREIDDGCDVPQPAEACLSLDDDCE